MANGWFVFAVVASIVLFTGFVLAVAILRAAWAQREREALTGSDLRALEESAVLLIDQLTSEADRSIEEIDRKCAELKELIAVADRKLEELSRFPLTPTLSRVGEREHSPHPDPLARGERESILELAAEGLSGAEIARAVGLSCAEVNLVLGINKIAHN